MSDSFSCGAVFLRVVFKSVELSNCFSWLSVRCSLMGSKVVALVTLCPRCCGSWIVCVVSNVLVESYVEINVIFVLCVQIM